MTETTRQLSAETALRWLHEHPGSTQGDCLDALVPGVGDAERAVWENRLRKWVYRDRQAGGARVSIGARGPTPAAPVPELVPTARANRADPDRDGEHEAVGLERIPFLQRKLSRTERLIELLIDDQQFRVARDYEKLALDLRELLDAAMERERRVVKLDRTPGAISAELAKRAAAIQLRAELQRRKEQRAAEAAKEG